MVTYVEVDGAASTLSRFTGSPACYIVMPLQPTAVRLLGQWDYRVFEP